VSLKSNPCRGDVVRVRLDPVEGSEQAGERPALVISPDIINEKGPLVLIAAITSKKTEKIYPFEVLLDPQEAGLPRRSKVMLMHMRAVDKRRLTGEYGSVGKANMLLVDEAIKVATGLVPM
jgi:mRNA interferase MazF